ncbi:hypothetical protein FHX16_005025 [Rhizobium sp. BK661]|nr:hypothetical protein [Rhizobium sp. BK661]
MPKPRLLQVLTRVGRPGVPAQLPTAVWNRDLAGRDFRCASKVGSS